jgi:hypothetical protein
MTLNQIWINTKQRRRCSPDTTICPASKVINCIMSRWNKQKYSDRNSFYRYTAHLITFQINFKYISNTSIACTNVICYMTLFPRHHYLPSVCLYQFNCVPKVISKNASDWPMLPRDVKFDWTVEFWNLYFYLMSYNKTVNDFHIRWIQGLINPWNLIFTNPCIHLIESHQLYNVKMKQTKIFRQK